MDNNDLGRVPLAPGCSGSAPSHSVSRPSGEHPSRVQLSRKKGWRMPPNTVKVDRTTRWGNPYKEGITPGNYASWFRADIAKETASERPTEDHPWSRHLHWIAHNLHALKGLNLACWCPANEPCHADVLLELANRDSDRSAEGGETGTGSTEGKSAGSAGPSPDTGRRLPNTGEG